VNKWLSRRYFILKEGTMWTRLVFEETSFKEKIKPKKEIPERQPKLKGVSRGSLA